MISKKKLDSYARLSDKTISKTVPAIKDARDMAQELSELRKLIVDEALYEEEYAGRMETYCIFCGEYQDYRKTPFKETHSPDCPVLKYQSYGEE